MANTSKIFSIFIYNESLPMKSYQFFKICKRFDQEREKTLMQQLMRKKNEINWTFFVIGCFTKSFNMIINHFLFHNSIHSPIFGFWYQDDIRNIKRGSREQKIARNGKLQYLVQKWFQSLSNDITQTIFFTDKMCMYDA